jgi:hypothetical protein
VWHALRPVRSIPPVSHSPRAGQVATGLRTSILWTMPTHRRHHRPFDPVVQFPYSCGPVQSLHGRVPPDVRGSAETAPVPADGLTPERFDRPRDVPHPLETAGDRRRGRRPPEVPDRHATCWPTTAATLLLLTRTTRKRLRARREQNIYVLFR